MSSDNYIYIDRKTFEVWSCTASCVTDLKKKDDLEKQKMAYLGKGKDLDKAIEIAEAYEEDLSRDLMGVEYGLHFKLWCK